ncbi:MAG: response regulator [Aggregatilineales bacterium]
MSVILVVEDSHENAQLIITAMESRGYEVVWVKDGNTAIDAALQVRPELILMDLRLPEKDGWQATYEIRNNPHLSHIPIIAISVEAKSDDRARAFDAGCNEYFSKPFSVVELREAVAHYIGMP